MKRRLLLPSIIAILVSIIFAGVVYATVYSKTFCYTHYIGGVRQWKHCSTVRFDWTGGAVKKADNGSQSFTAYVAKYSHTTYRKLCWEAYYATAGSCQHGINVYRDGVYQGLSWFDVKVTKVPNVWGWSHDWVR